MGALFFVLLGLFLTARHLSFAGAKWYLFSIRDSICIERFRQKQKAGDVIIASYNTVAVVVHLWATIMLMSSIFHFCISPIVVLSTAAIVILLLLLHMIYRYAIDARYSLKEFYTTVNEFKKKEDVVGEDNDYEVRFIQTYNEIKSEKWWNVVWIIYVTVLCAYLLVKL
ncbi:MAG: hypothetical protein IIY05_02785 [Alistipes sp.]|nr:hypothetical protein [Alistipes sp.]